MPTEYRLRPVRKEDLPLFFAHQADPEGVRLAAFASRNEDAFNAHWARIMSDPAVTIRTIVDVCEAVVGNIVAFDMAGAREVGYWIDPNHWGRGAATSGLRKFLKIETQRPLHASVAAHNAGSIRVLEKCGFRRTSEYVGETGTPMEVFVLP
jgi:RimJ/RimL family protein N-acetyltransferase